MACIQSGGIYALINVKGRTCLDLSGGDNRSVIGYPFHNSPNQAWVFERQQNGNFQIKSATGSYLRADGPPADGVRVVAGQAPFEWKVEDDQCVRQAVRLLVPGTWMNIDLSDHGNSTPGTPVELWGKWEGRNQLWTLQQIGG
ncbi:carbohydrate-binding module family 13 protein [Scleroderma citrinum Foug A]|uniref:Carbohydrate-binding module family 13 protein n=1 Tax=Scleroderma citrinum Foug A TaxID=1036808 RepID=A0A0C3DA23_9AGAM|nr:carbohydrate-binding module family 13 protein [Scleroderma citrinum Foug A]